jgi:hypothetical protein
VAKAKLAMADLAPVQYPTAQEAVAMFTLTVDFKPIAANQRLVGLPKGVEEWVHDKYAQNAEKATNEAMTEVLDRVMKHAHKLADSIKEDRKFHTSAITNLTGLVPMLRSFNFTNDHRFSALADEIEGRLSHHDLKSIKKAGKAALPDVTAVIDIMDQWTDDDADEEDEAIDELAS